MIELRQAGISRVRVRIDQPGQDHLARQIDYLGPRPARCHHVIVGAGANDTITLDGERLLNRKVAIDSHDLAAMKDQVGFLSESGIGARKDD